MAELTSVNINTAIVNKALNMIELLDKGFIYTNEDICNYNTLVIVKKIYENKNEVSEDALSNLCYIAADIMP